MTGAEGVGSGRRGLIAHAGRLYLEVDEILE